MRTISYPAGGWLPSGAHLELKWDDQGRDFATGWRGIVQAPGVGEVVAVHADRPFPDGFGPHYPIVRIDTGPWRGHEYYVGHCTALITPGERFRFGTPLARADQGHDWVGTHGGWVELGEAFRGKPGPKLTTHWFDPLVAHPMIIKVPDGPLGYGSVGLRVLEITADLASCGYLRRRWFRFNREVHGAVVSYRHHHHTPIPGNDQGIIDAKLWVDIQHSGQFCRQHHRHEV